MQELLDVFASETLATLLYALFAVLLTAVGLLAELHVPAELAVGHTALAVWFGAVGAVALYGGLYVVGYQSLVPRLAGR